MTDNLALNVPTSDRPTLDQLAPAVIEAAQLTVAELAGDPAAVTEALTMLGIGER